MSLTIDSIGEMQANYLDKATSQRYLLGSGCPCSACHRGKKYEFLQALEMQGVEQFQKRMADKVLNGSLSWDILAGLEIMAIWMNGEDVENRMKILTVRSAAEQLIEQYRENIQKRILKALLALELIGEPLQEARYLKNLLAILQSISTPASERVKLWLVKEVYKIHFDIRSVCSNHIPGKGIVDITNESFAFRWNAYQVDELTHLTGYYFDPIFDHEMLLRQLSQEDQSTINDFFISIPRHALRWKRFVNTAGNVLGK